MLSRLFRSRWTALFWAAGVVWTAYDVAGSTPAPPPKHPEPAAASDATGAPVNAADLAALASSSTG